MIAMIISYMGMGQNYRYIFSGLFTSINPSYFEVNYRGTTGFDPSPYDYCWLYCNYNYHYPKKDWLYCNYNYPIW